MSVELETPSIVVDLDLMEATASAEHIERFGVRPGDLIITKDSETSDDIGIPTLVESSSDDMVCGYHLSLLRPYLDRVDPGFLYWWLESSDTKGYWLTASFGVTRVSIPHGTVARLPVPAVDLDAQRVIAAYLDREAGEIDRFRPRVHDLEPLPFSRHFVDDDFGDRASRFVNLNGGRRRG